MPSNALTPQHEAWQDGRRYGEYHTLAGIDRMARDYAAMFERIAMPERAAGLMEFVGYLSGLQGEAPS
jgi:hypothetical protein